MKKFFNQLVRKLEVANNKSYIDFTYVLASSVPNGNGALFTKEELASAKDSILNTPLMIVPSYLGLPTEHSTEKFPALTDDAKIIGTHIASRIETDEDGVDHLIATSRVWKIRVPEIAQTMLKLHFEKDLKFSMECSYLSEIANGNAKELRDVEFIGSCVVNDPANPFSTSLAVASKKQGGHSEMTLEEALARIAQLEAQKELTDKQISDFQTDNKTLTQEKDALTESLDTTNQTVDSLKAEVASLKKEKEEKEKTELASKRFDEISKFIEYQENEVEAKKTAFASMSEDTFEILLDTAKRQAPEKRHDTAGISSDTKLNLKDKSNPLAGFEDIN